MLELVHSRDEAIDLEAINSELADASAEEVIEWAAERHGEQLVMTSSFGARSALMLHLVTRVIPSIPVIFLDTGYLFPETYQFAEALRERLDLRIEVFSPRMTAARQEALFGRLWDGDEDELARYQELNKVEPLQRALKDLRAEAWLAGLRGEQTAFRSGLERATIQDGLLKLHPILHWSNEDVLAYFTMHDLPVHPLLSFGYRSIGDTHSTVPTTDDMDERDGRLLGDKRECGIHLPRSAEENESLKSSGL